MRGKIDEGITATTYHDLSNLPDKGVEDAITELYLRALDFPKLADIKDLRDLHGLGKKDSGLMTTLGAQLVHEAFRWRYICVNIKGGYAEDFNRIVYHRVKFDDGQVDERYYIDDYHRFEPEWHDDPELDPDDGYGPIHAHYLVENEQGDSYRNADNYRWYIVSLYWEEVFTTLFEELDNADWTDKVVPKGANGQVPFPGEKPPPTRFVGRFSRSG